MAAVAAVAPPQHVCYLCCRKFPAAEALERHELTSDLHRQSLEKQDGLIKEHKEEVLAGITALRQQLHDEALAGQRSELEGRLRQLLGEFAQAQEMLEHSRSCHAARRAHASSGGAAGRPPTAAQLRFGQLELDIGAATWQGGKDMQEDRYMLNVHLRAADGQEAVGFCVLDGHSGSRCVDHLVEHLPRQLQAAVQSKPTLTTQTLEQAVLEACQRADDDFLAPARQLEAMDGSTMILGVLFQEEGRFRLLIANVGDSRAVLCRTTDSRGHLGALRLSQDQKPDRGDEKQRILAQGGEVSLQGVWRVCLPEPVRFSGRTIPRWGLAVSRSFGDLLLKEPQRYGCGRVAHGGLVTAEPELHMVDIDVATDRFLVLACDGIWDVLRDEDAVAVCAGQVGAELAAHSLVRHAFAAGSSDNLTVLVVAWSAID